MGSSISDICANRERDVKLNADKKQKGKGA